MIDSGNSAAGISDTGYFHNLFPNFTFGNYKVAQAYYASIQNGDRGNETDTLFNADTNPDASSGGQSFRFFYPQTTSIYAQSTIASSNYNALQLSVRHALHYGMEYDVNYTYSKSMDQGSSPERCSGGTLCSSGNYIVNAFDPSQQYAPSDFDVRHNITANYTAPLPFGRSMPFLNSGGFLERIFGGFSLTEWFTTAAASLSARPRTATGGRTLRYRAASSRLAPFLREDTGTSPADSTRRR